MSAALLTACGHPDPRQSQRHEEHRLPSPSRTTLVELLRKSHDTLDTTLAARAGYVVVGVHRDTAAAVVTLRQDASGVRRIGAPMDITGFGYPDVQLVPLPDGTMLRALTFDQAVEGMVGTVVDVLTSEGKVRREFDDAGAQCKAADFGVSGAAYTLREYRDSPFADDCMHPCAEAIRDALGFEPARVIVLERSANGWRPIPDSSGAQRAQAYARAVTLVRSGRLPECSTDSARVVEALTALQEEPRT